MSNPRLDKPVTMGAPDWKDHSTRAVLLLLTLLLVGFLGCTPGSDDDRDFVTSEYPEEKANIERMLADLEQAAEDLDLDRLDAFHQYGPKFSRLDDGRRSDAAEAQQIERDAFGSFAAFDATFSNLKIDVLGKTAIVTGLYEYEAQIDEATYPGRVSLTLVLVKIGEEWKIMHEGLFAMPDPSEVAMSEEDDTE